MRTKLWRGISVLASIAASVGAANAADLAVKAPVYKAPPVILSDWSGFYIGVHGGGGWGDSSFPATVNGVPGSVGIKTSGGLGGGHVGYNWQFGSWVVGVEGDFDGADIKGTNSNVFNTASGLSPTLKTDELASARGRLGYAVLPNLLAYGTGGFGWAHSVFNGGGAFGNQDLSQVGWTAGAGLEYKFYGHWMARAEYLHYGLDDKSLPQTTIKDNIDVVRGGVSYKF